jgi:hypothetical protein
MKNRLNALLSLRKQIDPVEALVVFLFFAAFLAVGLSIYKDYGYSTDEIYQQRLGYENYFYVHGTNNNLLENSERYHGPLFTLFLTMLEWKIGGPTTQGAFFARHLGTFLAFFVGVFLFYLIGRRVFRNWKLGLLGSAFLVLSPVIFSNSFYNSKDIAFLAGFTAAMFTMLLFLDHPNLLTAVIHALTCAALIAIRIPGIMAPAITVAVIGLYYFLGPRETRPGFWKLTGLVAFYGVLTLAAMVAFFPAMWSNPVENFIAGVFKFSKYEDWGGRIFYMGQFLTPDQLPWHYIPVFMSITTPLLYVGAFLAGLGAVIAKFLRRPLWGLDVEKRTWLAILMWLFLPPLVVIIGHSTVYNGWRHMYFIYPAFLLVALAGLRMLFNGFALQNFRWQWGRLAAWVLVGGLCLWSSIDTAVFMITNHPHQNVYFNQLAGPDMQSVKQNYDMDYWGLSFRSALEYIARTDSSEHILVMASNRTGEWNALMLPPKDQNRITFVTDIHKAQYYVGNYFTDNGAHPQPYDYPNEVFSVTVGDAKIATVYHLR